MKKLSPNNVRIKREYYDFMKESKQLSEDSLYVRCSFETCLSHY